MVESLLDVARQPFLELAADIHGSLVYLDAGAAEVAELTLGPAFLLGASTAAAVVVELLLLCSYPACSTRSLHRLNTFNCI